ncbi:MAG TPA: hypothetical protein VMC10_10450 [Stellaceae bacterium]|nr:hypothetical protein [Stellaceae bacterium]
MSDMPNVLVDRNLETATTISLRREPACFAFLCSQAASAPLPIDSINLDLASVDYYAGRASIWTTLEIRSAASGDEPTAILGFDESFLRPFTRAVIEASTTRAAYRMLIRPASEESPRYRVVEYVSGPGVPLQELLISPQDQVLLIAMSGSEGGEETLFQLPRSDSFLRAFVKMTHQADQVLRTTLAESERLARRRELPAPETKPAD